MLQSHPSVCNCSSSKAGQLASDYPLSAYHPPTRPLAPHLPCRLAKQQLRILIFPGTEVLFKQFPEVKAPEGHHILVPPPDRPSAEEAADAMEVAAITANM